MDAKPHLSPSIVTAFSAAILFGASIPFAKELLGNIPPVLLAGLLYLGSGLGLLLFRLIKDRGWQPSGLLKKEWLWLLCVIGFGGVLGPVLLMLGLTQTNAATASLLLNLEAVLTVLLAWVLFKESTDRRIIFGMLLIVIGSILLTWSNQISQPQWMGTIAIALACLCWAIDNNLTRSISTADPLFIASTKGLVAGITNISLAFMLHLSIPNWTQISYALMIGLLGYGISLVLFVLALRNLGTARTGAYFSTAPFIGAAIAILFFGGTTSTLFWIATLLMAIGVWIHLTESHEHRHTHEYLFHYHSHVHDEHHQHKHDFPWDGMEPHAHPHEHKSMIHTHRHYPDIHHRHKHKK
ncbi:DMT family transporter [Legionella micdadei]|uniref:Permease of the drug/metabolite transporter (DMT) superfamily n=1 Tax=Legionella micdadei TaxID=451 RepID=A0A098GH14_LEGMI|nr:DMT family transporter [Legionella micdadei]ARG97257.1 EamA family transporter [Legionella micdadei]ARH00438.1 EamA family transporter [Legionella micdadei]KTD28133.1 drug/transporter permease [Legionella micdadei]NSL16763.1 EamA family transporter [Legionella micdadei]CEG61285.1 putative transporter [Legionella micdadei]